MKKHKILWQLAPLAAALVLVAILFFSPLTIETKYSSTQLKEFAADPMNRNVFIGYSVKEQAFSQKNFLPILGSSELEHFDPYHPSSFFAKYDSSVTPFLAGQPGTQSLTQFFFVNSAGEALKNRKIVFVISPQWFSPQGIGTPELANFTSKGELYSWITSANPESAATQELAKRLLNFKNFPEDLTITSALKSLSAGKKPSTLTMLQLSAAEQLWKREDALFSGITAAQTNLDTNADKVQSLSSGLPDSLNFSRLNQLATENGQKNGANNPYQIQNSVWTKSIKKVAKARHGVMRNVSYQQSPEYADFQQLLNQFAENHDDVEFIIQPVNGAWYSYSGLSYQTLDNFSQKIRYQLNSQGFHNVLDLTDKYHEKYYIGDTIHLGNRGWVAVDEATVNFLKQSMENNYQLNNDKFLSENWQLTKNVQ